MNNNFYLGIDYGTKKTGIAIAQEITKQSRPLKIIYSDYINRIQDIITEWSIRKIIIGFPYHEKESRIHAEIRTFYDDLKNNIDSNIDVILFDETLSSSIAKKDLSYMRKDGLIKKKNVHYDDISASIILQSWINENIMD